MTAPFDAGRTARIAGLDSSANPHIVGYTKLGSPKLSDDGIAWLSGFSSIGRVASDKEVHAARSVDVTRFRRKANRYYR